MTENDFNSGPGSHEQAEPLSATGMFLRAFDSESPQSQAAPEAEPAKPVTAPAPSVSSPSSSGSPG